MTLNKRIEAFSTLGKFLKQFSINGSAITTDSLNERFFNDFNELIQQVSFHNAWFTVDNVKNAITALATTLEEKQLESLIIPYREQINKPTQTYRVAVIMAGNVPLVGFHDFLCVLISGNTFVGKLSSDDKLLLPFLS